MNITKKYVHELTYQIIGSATEVHKILGPGLLESVYEKCFCRELALRGVHYRDQATVNLTYKGLDLETNLRCDVVVDELVVVELKTVDCFEPIHEAVLLTYMLMLKKPKGILINYNCTNIFKEGQKTLVNDFFRSLPDE